MACNMVSFVLSTNTDEDYTVLQIAVKAFDDPNHWPVKEYKPKERTIVFESVRADMEDVFDFAKAILDLLSRGLSRHPDLNISDFNFTIEGFVEYMNSGEECGYKIEKNNDRFIIQETENYWFFGTMYFEDYEEFHEEAEELCRDVDELCPENDFDADCEYCITYDKIYADEFPEYSKSQEIKISDITDSENPDNDKAKIEDSDKNLENETDAVNSNFDITNLKGKKIVLSGFTDPDEADDCLQAIEILGGIEQNEVGPDTDCVIFNCQKGKEGDQYRLALKKNAEGQNIVLISDDDFLYS